MSFVSLCSPGQGGCGERGHQGELAVGHEVRGEGRSEGRGLPLPHETGHHGRGCHSDPAGKAPGGVQSDRARVSPLLRC